MFSSTSFSYRGRAGFLSFVGGGCSFLCVFVSFSRPRRAFFSFLKSDDKRETEKRREEDILPCWPCDMRSVWLFDFLIPTAGWGGAAFFLSSPSLSSFLCSYCCLFQTSSHPSLPLFRLMYSYELEGKGTGIWENGRYPAHTIQLFCLVRVLVLLLVWLVLSLVWCGVVWCGLVCTAKHPSFLYGLALSCLV